MDDGSGRGTRLRFRVAGPWNLDYVALGAKKVLLRSREDASVLSWIPGSEKSFHQTSIAIGFSETGAA